MIKDTGTQTVYRGQNERERILSLTGDPTRPPILYLEHNLSAHQHAGVYRACDCLVQPYRGEGFCLPALEARACGLPVQVPGFALPAMKGITDPLDVQVTFTRNANGQETSRQDPYGATLTTLYDAASLPIGKVNSLGNFTTYTRDSFHNVTSMQTADGAITTNIWGYGGSSFDTTGAKRRLQAQINALGQITSYSLNGRGQIAAVISPIGAVTSYGYDSFGNNVSTMDPSGNLTTRVFDLAGNVIAQVNPLGNIWTSTLMIRRTDH